jgi:hypothetical protein
MKNNLLFIILFLVLATCKFSAQTVSVESKWLTDEIPARTTQQSLSLVLPIGETWKLRSTYRYQFSDQEEFVGLPRIRTAIHSFENIFVTSIRQWRLDLAAGAKMNMYPDGSLMGDYHFAIHFSQPLFYSFDGPSVVMTLHGEASRNRETNTATAIDRQISSKDFSGSIEFDIQKMFTVSGKYTQQYYSDSNEKISAYAALLYHPFSNPWVAVGYAYAYSNSLFNNWKLTNSVRLGFDPMTRLTTYEYSYFYNPYFTPMKEQGHLAIGVIQWGIISNLAIYAKATIPFSSTGLQKYSPSTGTTPAPIDYDLYYELDGILPTQYEASIITDILDPVTIRLNAEYFKKPYYSYSAFGINMTIAF